MVFSRVWRAVCLLALGTGMMCQTAAGQSFVKIVPDSDILSGEAFSDSLLTRVAFPHAVSNLSNYPKINIAAIELMKVLEDPNIELSRIYVCGSTSPVGLWGDNVKLSQARTDNVAKYLQPELRSVRFGITHANVSLTYRFSIRK